MAGYAMLPFFALMIAYGYRRAKPPDYEFTWRDRSVIACVVVAVLFPPTWTLTALKGPSRLTLDEAAVCFLAFTALGLVPLGIYSLIVLLPDRPRSRT